MSGLPLEFPFDTLPSPKFEPWRGHLHIAAGWSCLLLSVVVPAFAGLVNEGFLDTGFALLEDPWFLTIVVVLSYLGLLAAIWLIRKGRRMRAIPATEVLAKDKRPPVLFLRSFDDDDLYDPSPIMVPMGDVFQRRYEVALIDPLSKIGPMVSIGRPGNTMAMLGGARLFVPDHAWQPAIEHLRGEAGAVIVMVGRTEGVWWEITSSIEKVPLDRLLFFFPYVEQANLRRSFWQRVLNYMPARMPFSTTAYRRMEAERQARYVLFRERVQSLLSKPLPPALGANLFIDFDVEGNPRLIETIRPWYWPLFFMTPSTQKMVADLKRTLKPFVVKLSA